MMKPRAIHGGGNNYLEHIYYNLIYGSYINRYGEITFISKAQNRYVIYDATKVRDIQEYKKFLEECGFSD